MEDKVIQLKKAKKKVMKSFQTLSWKEAKIETLKKCKGDKITALGEWINDIGKTKEETPTNNLNDDKIVKMENNYYILEKRRLGYYFFEYCEKEFNSGSE